MSQDRRYAVHVRNEEESRAVQERFFEMGIPWAGPSPNMSYVSNPTDVCAGDAAIGFGSRLRYAHSSYYRREGWAVITAQEFLSGQRQVMMITPKEGQ